VIKATVLEPSKFDLIQRTHRYKVHRQHIQCAGQNGLLQLLALDSCDLHATLAAVACYNKNKTA
jgi:hypothetical protein